jgi:hypothetical protein
VILKQRLHPFAAAAVLGMVMLLTGCEPSPHDASDESVRERLVGHWLRDYDEGNLHVRRLLVLQSDGQFRESVRAVDASGQATELENEGEWLFDGTNLKRRYKLLDGKTISAPFAPFATFEIKFESNREFIGLDHVHKRSVRYQRVQEGAVL